MPAGLKQRSCSHVEKSVKWLIEGKAVKHYAMKAYGRVDV
jgi:hypothetical protein